MQQEAG